MKLLFCPRCHDLFKLSMKLKSCDCGMCKGKYINDSEAVTNGHGISVAIGNGSLLSAIENMKDAPDHSSKGREWWIENAKIEYAWVRPNEGIGNPHTSIDEDIREGKRYENGVDNYLLSDRLRPNVEGSI